MDEHEHSDAASAGLHDDCAKQGDPADIYTFDDGRLVSCVSPLGEITVYSYDAEARPIGGASAHID